MNKKSSTVSVITPVFNSSIYLRGVVESVFNQSHKVFEHILIDDGSADNSLEIMKGLKKEFDHLVILKQDNQGAGKARNLGISKASGQYISFLDSDDLWMEKKIENQIKFMEYNNLDFTYGDYFRVESSGNTTKVLTPTSLSYHELLISCPIGCLTATYNQHSLGKVYMSSVRQGQDWSLWLSITRSGTEARKYPGCLAYYNVVQGSLSKNKIKKIINMYKIYRISEKLSIFKSCYYLFKHILNILTRSR